MGYAFISYSTKNQAAADAIRNLFNRHDIDTWMAPYDIPVGSKYAAVITKSIRECSCFVLLLSNDSQASDVVDSEVELAALTFKKAIIPVEIEKVVLNDSFTFYLHNKQILGVQEIDETSQEIKQILAVVRTYTQGDSVATEIDATDAVAEDAFNSGDGEVAETAPTYSTEGVEVESAAPSSRGSLPKVKARINHRDIVDVDFRDWLLHRPHSPNVADDYIFSLYRAERLGVEYGLSPFELIVVDSVKVRSAIDSLFSVEEFVEFNKKNHGKLKAALDRWYEFIVEREGLKTTSTLATKTPTVIPNSDFVIEDGVLKKYIGSSTQVVVPAGVTTIVHSAFSDCTSITSITIPASVTCINDCTFSFCSNLTSITVDSDNDYYISVDGVLFNKIQTEIIQYPKGKTNKTYIIPNTVTTICNFAFSGCKGINSIIIPDSVTIIDDMAFVWSSNLSSITIPNSVRSIGDGAFYDCSNLKNVNIPYGLLMKSKDAFDEELYEKLVARASAD